MVWRDLLLAACIHYSLIMPMSLRTQAPAEQDAPLRAPRLVDDLAGWVSDRTGMPTNTSSRSDEHNAYCRTLLTARFVSEKAFANSVLPSVTYAHLFEEPEKYRGEVIRVEGRVRRVRKFDAPMIVRSDVPHLYECGIFDLYRSGVNPVIAVVTELPPQVPVGEDVDVPVAFHGYFFKRLRYEAGDGVRDAPLLIGRTLLVDPGFQAAPTGDITGSYSRELVLAALALISVTSGVIGALAWWYRRSDRRVRERIAACRTGQQHVWNVEHDPRSPDVATNGTHYS